MTPQSHSVYTVAILQITSVSAQLLSRAQATLPGFLLGSPFEHASLKCRQVDALMPYKLKVHA